MDIRTAFLQKSKKEEIPTPAAIKDVPLAQWLERTGQDKLPQAQILTNAVKHLENTGLVEAYLRGSFSYGRADIHSDIDLFLVVEPEDLPETFRSFKEHFEKSYNVISICHDRLVADYGGIGFTFMGLDKNNKYFLFDFYMAMKGVPPKKPLASSAPRIFARDPSYCWLSEGQGRPLPQATQEFIHRFTKGNTREQHLELLLNEVMIVLSIAGKHLSRKQVGRALSDNTHLSDILVETAFAGMNIDTDMSGLWAVDEFIRLCRQDEDPKTQQYGDDFKKLLLEPISFTKVQEFYDLALRIQKDFSPSILQKMDAKLALFERHVMTPPVSQPPAAPVPLPS